MKVSREKDLSCSQRIGKGVDKEKRLAVMRNGSRRGAFNFSYYSRLEISAKNHHSYSVKSNKTQIPFISFPARPFSDVSKGSRHASQNVSIALTFYPNRSVMNWTLKHFPAERVGKSNPSHDNEFSKLYNFIYIICNIVIASVGWREKAFSAHNNENSIIWIWFSHFMPKLKFIIIIGFIIDGAL